MSADPTPTAAEAAELHKILVDQGAIPADAPVLEVAPTPPVVEGEEELPPAPEGEVFDTPEEAAEAAAMTGEEPAEAAPPAEQEALPEAAQEPPAEGEAPDLKRGWSSVAQKEAELVKQRQAMSAEIQRQAQAMAQQMVQQHVAQLENEARFNPLEFYKKRGINPAEVAAQLFYGENSENVPPEIRGRYDQIALQRQFQQLQQQQAQFQAQVAEQQAKTQAISYLEQVVRRIPEDMPHLHALAKVDPGQTVKDMYDEAMQLRSQGALVGLSDEEMAAKIAMSLERKHERVAKRYVPLAKMAPKAPPPPPVNGAAKQTPPGSAVKTPPAKSISKQGPSSRPAAEPKTREEEIAEVVARLTRGDHLKG
jgi:hypothetical protein